MHPWLGGVGVMILKTVQIRFRIVKFENPIPPHSVPINKCMLTIKEHERNSKCPNIALESFPDYIMKRNNLCFCYQFRCTLSK